MGTSAAVIGVKVALPFPFSTRRVGEVPRAGPYAAFLDSEYNPVWTDMVGTATKSHIKTLRDMEFTDNDPYIGCSPDSHFIVPSATALLDDVTLDRLDSTARWCSNSNRPVAT